MIGVFGWKVSISGLVVVSAIFPLLAFYFMDRLWYHRLLDGSVEAGIDAEAALKALGYRVDLGSQIKAKSPFTLWLLRTPIHSKTKMDIFYVMLVVTLLIVGSCLAFGIHPQPKPILPVASPATVNTGAAQIAPPVPHKPVNPADAAAVNATKGISNNASQSNSNAHSK